MMDIKLMQKMRPLYLLSENFSKNRPFNLKLFLPQWKWSYHVPGCKVIKTFVAERKFSCIANSFSNVISFVPGISMHKGYAFVQFANPFDARSGCLGEDGRTISGQVIGKGTKSISLNFVIDSLFFFQTWIWCQNPNLTSVNWDRQRKKSK